MKEITDSIGSLLGRQLASQELDALSKAGGVCAERHRATVRYRLRFRVGRRQVAISLGRDRERADMMRSAVARLQAPRRAEQQLKAALVTARRQRRLVKQLLQPVVERMGYRWHGLSIRRPRTRKRHPPTLVG